MVPFSWSAVALNLATFFLFVIPKARRNRVTLNLGCLAIHAGVYTEKGMGLIIPGFTPDPLGEIYQCALAVSFPSSPDPEASSPPG